MSSLVLIRKSVLINPSLFQWSFQYSLQYFPIVSLYSQESCCISFYHLCEFLYRNFHSITKKSRAISCHRLFHLAALLRRAQTPQRLTITVSSSQRQTWHSRRFWLERNSFIFTFRQQDLFTWVSIKNLFQMRHVSMDQTEKQEEHNQQKT